MKKLAILIVIIFGLLIFWDYSSKPDELPQNQPVFTGEPMKDPPIGQGVPRNPSAEASEYAQDGWKIYLNEKAGFKITFFDSWKGFKVDSNIISGKDGASRVQVGFGGWEPNDYYLFSLFEEPKKTYRETLASKTDSSYALSYVGDSSDKKNAILCYGICCEGGRGIDKYSEFERSRCAEVPEILKTFQNID